MDQPPTSSTLSPTSTVTSPQNDPAESEKSNLAPPALAQPQDSTIPQPAMNGTPFELEFLLMGGQRRRWTVGSQDTVEQVRTRIWNEWPPGTLVLSPYSSSESIVT